jgi:enolase
MAQEIKSIEAKEIKDSRGKPTIEVEAKTEDFSVKAGVPSGASTGKLEARVIDTVQAIKNVNEIIGPQLINKNPCEQKKIDDFLIKLDGTEDKSNLGANAILGISMAIAKLGAQSKNLSLWKHINEISKSKPSVPFACFNIINGGAHAENDLDIQEFMIVPQNQTFTENFQIAKNIYQSLRNTLKDKFREIEIGDEGGFAPLIFSTEEALDLITRAIERIDVGSKIVKIILDCAASQFEKHGKYQIDNFSFSKEELLNFYSNLIYFSLGFPLYFFIYNFFMLINYLMHKMLLIIGINLYWQYGELNTC